MTTPELDIVFFCDSNKDVGFGHLRRSLDIVREMSGKRTVGMYGNFSREAKSIIREKELIILEDDNFKAKVVTIDTMFDPQDMDYYNKEVIKLYAAKGKRSLLIASGFKMPENLPVDIVVGHFLEAGKEPIPAIKIGLQYAPVGENFKKWAKMEKKIRREVKYILLAFGGVNESGPLITLEAIEQIGYKGNVDILVSPLLDHEIVDTWINDNTISFKAVVYQNIPDIAEIVFNSDIVIGSYGNITYESLSLGTPFLALNFKKLQDNYSDHLCGKGLIQNAGLIDTIGNEELAENIKKIFPFSVRSDMCSSAKKAVDALGIKRIANIILELAEN